MSPLHRGIYMCSGDTETARERALRDVVSAFRNSQYVLKIDYYDENKLPLSASDERIDMLILILWNGEASIIGDWHHILVVFWNIQVLHFVVCISNCTIIYITWQTMFFFFAFLMCHISKFKDEFGWFKTESNLFMLCNFGFFFYTIQLASTCFGVNQASHSNLYYVWLRITDEDSIPEMNIWSVLLIQSDF